MICYLVLQKWLQSWRAKLDLNPQEPELICQLIQEILRCRDHPLTFLLKQYQYRVYEKIYPLVSNKKQRLAAVSVPLDRSLWPPELCDDAVAEECRLDLFLKTNGDGGGEGDGESQDKAGGSGGAGGGGGQTNEGDGDQTNKGGGGGGGQIDDSEGGQTNTCDVGVVPTDVSAAAVSQSSGAQGEESCSPSEEGGGQTDEGDGDQTDTGDVSVCPTDVAAAVSRSSRDDGEDSVQNPGASAPEVTVTGQADDSDGVFCGKEMADGDSRKGTPECGEEKFLENKDPKEISAVDMRTGDSASPSTSDSNKCLVSKADEENNCHVLDSAEDGVRPVSDSGDENGNKKPDGAPDSGLDSNSDKSEVTDEATEAAGEDSEDSSNPSQETGNHEIGPSDIDSAVELAVKTTEDTKESLSRAMEKGEELQAELQAEQVKAARLLHQVTHDYESYNAENMDDLFDDDDDDDDDDGGGGDEETASHKKNKAQEDVECDLPESDQPTSLSAPSHASRTGPESLVSRSSSGGSVQDFPSLPSSVGEGQAEIERLSKEAYQRHVKNISADVHMYLEKLLILFTIAYEQLDSPLGRDQCYASLEETFFKPLWKFLLMLFR